MHTSASLKSEASPRDPPSELSVVRVEEEVAPRMASPSEGGVARFSRKHRNSLTERVPQRGVALAFVVVLHMALFVLLTNSFGRRSPIQEPTPLQVQLIEQPPVSPESEPLPPVPLEVPRLEPLPVPQLMIDVPPSQTAITVPVQALASPTRDAAPRPVITPPQFNADYLSNPAPTYPPISRRLHEEGTVVLRVRVTPGGQAADVRLEQTSGSARLDTAAMNAVRHWRFVPARRGQEVVEAWVLIPIEFDLKA